MKKGVLITLGLLVLGGILLGRLTGYGLGVGIAGGSEFNFDHCVSEYVKPARSELGARATMAACSRLKSDSSTPGDRQWAECVLDKVPETGNEIGARLALQECNGR